VRVFPAGSRPGAYVLVWERQTRDPRGRGSLWIGQHRHGQILASEVGAGIDDERLWWGATDDAWCHLWRHLMACPFWDGYPLEKLRERLAMRNWRTWTPAEEQEALIDACIDDLLDDQWTP